MESQGGGYTGSFCFYNENISITNNE